MPVELDRWRAANAPDILGSSPELTSALDFARRVGATSSAVLITGETGTGKELFARAIHRASERHARPFIAVNCAAIPDNLIEAELFGYLKGAFTGAVSNRVGRFAAAHGGTLFLDEIGELPLAAQAKLLRVLESRMVCPVGADVEQPVDVRIIAATHRDLEDMVDRGSFRADLYFRISVLPLHLPTLRDRGDDLFELVDAIIAKSERRVVTGLEPAAKAALAAYSWPGNVRELHHVLERALILSDGPLLRASDLNLDTRRRGLRPAVVPMLAHGSRPDLPVSPPATSERADEDPDNIIDLRTALEGLERRLINRALARAQGNRTEAAALLGLNRTTLVEKLRKYG